jgi:hypothetical protein
MTTLTLVHTETSRRFEVLSVDRDAGTILLKGEHATFTEKYDPARFKALGYRLEKKEG